MNAKIYIAFIYYRVLRDLGMHKRKPYRKKFHEDRQTCTFRTTQNDRANLDKTREFFSLQHNKKVSKNIAINSAIEYVARIHTQNLNNKPSTKL